MHVIESDVDIWLITHGYQLAVLHLQTASLVDTGEPTHIDSGGTFFDSGGPSLNSPDDLEATGRMSGCSCTTRFPFPWG